MDNVVRWALDKPLHLSVWGGSAQQLGAGRCGHQRAGPGRPRRQVRQRLPWDGRRCPETPGTGERREMCGCGGWHSPEGAGKRLSHWQGCSSCGLEVARERSAWPPQLASTAPHRLGTGSETPLCQLSGHPVLSFPRKTPVALRRVNAVFHHTGDPTPFLPLHVLRIPACQKDIAQSYFP